MATLQRREFVEKRDGIKQVNTLNSQSCETIGGKPDRPLEALSACSPTFCELYGSSRTRFGSNRAAGCVLFPENGLADSNKCRRLRFLELQRSRRPIACSGPQRRWPVYRNPPSERLRRSCQGSLP